MKYFILISILLISCADNTDEDMRLFQTSLGKDTGGEPVPLPIIDESSYKIIFDGNSWVEGTGSTDGHNYPNQLKALLDANSTPTDIINFGVGGQTIPEMISDAVAQIDPYASTHNVLIGIELVNTWGLDESLTKEEIYILYKQYFVDRKAAGFQYVIALTVFAQSGVYPRPNWDSDREYWRQMMLDEFPDLGIYVADVGNDPRLQDSRDLTYYDSDRIHLNNTGYGVVAGVVFGLFKQN